MYSFLVSSCAGCIFLKGIWWGTKPSHQCYCEKSGGLNISGTLERLDKCVKENWKESDDGKGDNSFRQQHSFSSSPH
jgi:hypothetical protein